MIYSKKLTRKKLYKMSEENISNLKKLQKYYQEEYSISFLLNNILEKYFNFLNKRLEKDISSCNNEEKTCEKILNIS